MQVKGHAGPLSHAGAARPENQNTSGTTPPADKHPAAAAWRDRDLVVGERGWGDVLPLPPPAVRRPAAAAWIDRNRVVEEVRRGDLLPPPPLAEKHPTAAAWRNLDVVVGGRQVADL